MYVRFPDFIHVIHVRVLCVTSHVLVCAHVGMPLSVSPSELTCNCVHVQLERVLYSLVVDLLYQLALQVTHTGDDGVQQWLEELRNDRLGE